MPDMPPPPAGELIGFTTKAHGQIVGTYSNGLYYDATRNGCWSAHYVTEWHRVRVLAASGAQPAGPTEAANRPLQPGEYVQFRAFGSPTFPGEDRPGRIVRFLPCEMVVVHWLDEDGEHPVPLDRLTRAEPDPQVLPIEDEDGAPVPAELQRGGQLWMAALDGVRSGFLGRAAEQSQAYDLEAAEAADSVMIRLTPILWPLLPSNDASPAAVIAQHGGIFQQRAEALSDLEHLATLALQFIAEHPDGQEPGWRAAAIDQLRRDLRVLGVTDPELDAAGIRHPAQPEQEPIA